MYMCLWERCDLVHFNVLEGSFDKIRKVNKSIPMHTASSCRDVVPLAQLSIQGWKLRYLLCIFYLSESLSYLSKYVFEKAIYK